MAMNVVKSMVLTMYDETFIVMFSRIQDKRQAAEDKANGKLTPNQSNAETSTTDTIIVYGEYPVINGTLLDQIAQQQGV
jgi:hypothetical protein